MRNAHGAVRDGLGRLARPEAVQRSRMARRAQRIALPPQPV